MSGTDACPAFVQVTSGRSFSVWLANDGSVWSAGDDANGQLGDGGAAGTQSNVPVRTTFPAGVRITQVSSGAFHSIALGSDGTVYTWGDDAAGNIGTGADAPTPVVVPLPGGRRAEQVVAGALFSAVLAKDGTVWEWGSDQYGQLANGTTSAYPTVQETPIQAQIPAGVTITSLAASTFYTGLGSADGAHVLAVASDGSVWGWGRNNTGQLGEGIQNDHESLPVRAQLPAGVRIGQVATGGAYSLALSTTGQVYAWGYNADGELGNAAGNSDLPVPVTMPAGVAVAELASSGWTSFARSTSGALYAWGSGIAPYSSIQPIALPSGVTAASLARSMSSNLFIDQHGNGYGWGKNGNGQLGNGTTTNPTPAPVLGPNWKLGSVNVGGTAVTGLSGDCAGWTATTPAHTEGTVPVEVSAALWAGTTTTEQAISIAAANFTFVDPPAVTAPAVTAGATAELAETGTDPLAALLLAAVCLLTGAGLVFSRHVRRDSR